MNTAVDLWICCIDLVSEGTRKNIYIRMDGIKQ